MTRMNKNLLGVYQFQLFIFSAVPAFSEEGRQQAADHATEEKTLQEPNHPRLQNPGRWGHQHGGGTAHGSRWAFVLF